MTREELLRNRDYILSQLQLDLLNLIGNYKDKKKLKDYQLAEQLGVSKGYVSQLLNGTFDHKLSKVVDLALACNMMPLLHFEDLDTFIKEDAKDNEYQLIPMPRPRNMTWYIPPVATSINPIAHFKSIDKVNISEKTKTEAEQLCLHNA